VREPIADGGREIAVQLLSQWQCRLKARLVAVLQAGQRARIQ
jgi:hypothetical protein